MRHLERRVVQQRASVGETLSCGGVSGRVELDQRVEAGPVERSVGTHLEQVERPEGREGGKQLDLTNNNNNTSETNMRPS